MRQSADRAPALRRRGPNTSGGKARSARNALRYGLSLPVLADPATAAEVEALARQMGSAGDADVGELARAVAQAQVDLIRIRRARQGLIAAVFSHVAEKTVIGPGGAPIPAPRSGRATRGHGPLRAARALTPQIRDAGLRCRATPGANAGHCTMTRKSRAAIAVALLSAGLDDSRL
jgi:hypothetical protein